MRRRWRNLICSLFHSWQRFSSHRVKYRHCLKCNRLLKECSQLVDMGREKISWWQEV